MKIVTLKMATIEVVPVTTETEQERTECAAIGHDISAVARSAEDKPVEHAIEQESVEQVVEVAELPRETPKRKPGRPVGSRSKIPGKPRAPRQKRVVVEDVTEEPEEMEVERVLPNSRPIPTHGYDNKAAIMLAMLQQQADDRKNRKAALYKSWFS